MRLARLGVGHLDRQRLDAGGAQRARRAASASGLAAAARAAPPPGSRRAAGRAARRSRSRPTSTSYGRSPPTGIRVTSSIAGSLVQRTARRRAAVHLLAGPPSPPSAGVLGHRGAQRVRMSHRERTAQPGEQRAPSRAGSPPGPAAAPRRWWRSARPRWAGCGGGRRPGRSPAATSTSCVYGTPASDRVTRATGSKPSGTVNVATPGVTAPIRSSRKRADLPAPVVVAGDVPAAGVEDQPVRVELAVRLLAAPGAVVQCHPLPVPGGRGQREQGARRRPRSGSGRRRVKPRCSCTAASRSASAAGSTRRIFASARGGGGLLGGQPDPLGDDEAEQHGHRLVVGEHQRRQLVAGVQPVAAVAAPVGGDRDAQLDQRGRVPAHGPLVHAEPCRRGRRRSTRCRVCSSSSRASTRRRDVTRATPPNRADTVRIRSYGLSVTERRSDRWRHSYWCRASGWAPGRGAT